MRAVLLIAAAVGIAFVLMAEFSSGLRGVSCSLPEHDCPEVRWLADIRWTNDTPTIRPVEFREVPLDWGVEMPFEPEWAASVENWLDPTQAAACRSDNRGGVECHYIEYGGDAEDLPWYVQTTSERVLTWCRAGEHQDLILRAYRLRLWWQADGNANPATFRQELDDWLHRGGELTETVDRACLAAFSHRY